MPSITTSAAAPEPAEPVDYDVVVIGGGFAGAASAILLRRFAPQAKVLVVERAKRHGKKVGEATVEVSAYFLHHVLGLYDHLSRHQLPKHGLRYWFTDRDDRRLAEMSEVGGRELPLLPSFQLDRSALDDHLVEQAAAAGAEIVREARVETVRLGWPASEAMIRRDGRRRTVRARWIIDASGREGFLATRSGKRRYFEDMTTAAVWARFQGVADMDAGDGELLGGRGAVMSAARRLATNHFCGYGWWCWVIPLRGGETSIGLVYDKRLFDPGLNVGGPRAAFQRFLAERPGLREITAKAKMVEHDFNLRRQLAYTVDAYAGKGWALVGDAASFLDPFYSPGLDHASISIFATTRMIGKQLSGGLDEPALDSALAFHNGMFGRSIPRWLTALYIDKYEIMGDAELMRCSFLVDTSLYYLGVVAPVHRDPEALGHPVFGLPLPQTRIAAAFMRVFKGRLVRLARFRLQTGTYGRRNIGWRPYGRAFDLRFRSIEMLAKGLWMWLRLELGCLRHRVGHGGVDVSKPAVLVTPPARPDRSRAAPKAANAEETDDATKVAA